MASSTTTTAPFEGASSEKQESGSDFEVPRWVSHIFRRMLMPRPVFMKNHKLKPTSWLDGLRGFAAFLVYWHHHILWSHSGTQQSQILEMGYGYEGNRYFACLPIIRNFFTGGHYSVATFFVISGYVLSAKPLSFVLSGEYDKLADNLGSALFRRWLRLYIPTYAVTFLWMTSWHALGLWTAPFVPEKNYWDELWKWWEDWRNYSWIYRGGGADWLYYNLHTWSIPFEFRGSIVIFTAILAFSRQTRNARMVCNIGLMIYGLYITDGWFISMFVAGMMICELDQLAARDELPNFLKRLEPNKTMIYSHLFVVSLLLGGVPSANNNRDIFRDSPGWYYLSFLAPHALLHYKWFFLFFAAAFLVASVPRIPFLKRFFETKFCQYLGKVSFSLYLVHGPMIWTLGDKVYQLVGWPKDPMFNIDPPSYFDRFHLPKVGIVGLEPAFLIPNIVLLPATLWVASVCTTVFDETSVKIAAWCYRQTKPSPDDKQKERATKMNGVYIQR